MSINEIGCCGAYCGTCRVLKENLCKGCKSGYENGKRDILKARCKMKVCCLHKKLQSCADCEEYAICIVINEFYGKKGFKYQKYKQAIEYIRVNGYEAFLKIADTWDNVFGKFESSSKKKESK